MIRKAINTLSTKLSDDLSLSNSSLETLCLLVIGISSVRTANLSHISGEMPTQARVESTCRRLQRFFQYVDPGEDWSARLVVRMLGLSVSWDPCLDRTNWRIGRKEINLLVLAIATRRYHVPLIWTVPGKAGNSNTKQRIALLKRYPGLFGAESIKCLLADREFIGLDWLTFLHEQDVPFIIRVKSNQYVTCEDGTRQSLRNLLRTCRGKRTFSAHFGAAGDTDPMWLNFAVKRIKGKELLIVASNRPAHHALTTYRKRWAIECLFAEAKTKGFNLEDTRLSIAKKVSLLIGIVALAMAWAAKMASKNLAPKSAPENHTAGTPGPSSAAASTKSEGSCEPIQNKPFGIGPKSDIKSHESCTGRRFNRISKIHGGLGTFVGLGSKMRQFGKMDIPRERFNSALTMDR